MFPLLSAKKFSVALFASGDEKSGVGSVSCVPPLVFWNWPKPRNREALPEQVLVGPAETAESAASMASRAPAIVGLRGIITIAS